MTIDTGPAALLITLTSRPVGIAMPAPAGFEFVAIDPEFELLDRSSFRRIEQLEQATQSMARVVEGRGRSEVTSVPLARPGVPADILVS